MPCISILMPVYNAETYLSEAIASVLNQTFPDWELIIVDDGSSDRSPAILASFDHDSRIRGIRSPHLGPSAARNLGISQASGTFVTFLDADDAFFPDSLESSLRHFQADPDLDVVYGGHPLPCDPQMTPDPRMQSRIESVRSFQEVANRHPVAALFNNLIASQLSSLLVRRSFLLETGLFNPNLTVGEDFDLFLRLFKRGRSKLLLDRFVIRYRINPDSVMHSPRYRHKRLQGTRFIVAAIAAHEFSEPALNARKQYFASQKWLDMIDKLLNPKNKRLCFLLLGHFVRNKAFSSRGLVKRLLKLSIKLSWLH